LLPRLSLLSSPSLSLAPFWDSRLDRRTVSLKGELSPWLNRLSYYQRVTPKKKREERRDKKQKKELHAKQETPEGRKEREKKEKWR